MYGISWANILMDLASIPSFKDEASKPKSEQRTNEAGEILLDGFDELETDNS